MIRLYSICSRLSSFPFELNAKLKYGFQISEQYRAVCTGADNAYENKKEGYDASKDIGICVTCIMSFDNSSESKGFELMIDGEKLSLDRGDLAILKPRYTGNYSLKMKTEKSMALIFWVSGPRDLKNGQF